MSGDNMMADQVMADQDSEPEEVKVVEFDVDLLHLTWVITKVFIASLPAVIAAAIAWTLIIGAIVG
jgi:hypothetical protein